MAIQRIVLSGSTNGRPITVASVAASCNQAIHTVGSAVTGADNLDEIWLWAIPLTTSTGLKQLFLQLGSDSTADIKQLQLANDPAVPNILVLPGKSLNNSLVLSAWATACNSFALDGHAFQVRA